MDDLAAAFTAHTAGASCFSRRMAIALADMDGSSPKDLVLRLERLKLLALGSWQWFLLNGGITKEHLAEVREMKSFKTSFASPSPP